MIRLNIRYSFSRFLGLCPDGQIPDARMVRLFLERLKKKRLVDRLFDLLMQQVNAAGVIARKGQIVGANFVSAPRQRNSRGENVAIKKDETPEVGRKSPIRSSGKITLMRAGLRNTRPTTTVTRIMSASTARTS